MLDRTNETKRLRQMSLIYIKTRWFYLIAQLTTGAISKVTGNSNLNFPVSSMALLGLIAIVLNITLIAYFRNEKKVTYRGAKAAVIAQIVTEILVMTATVFYAGGIISLSFATYYYTIVASAFFYQLRGVMVTAALISIAYSGLILAQLYRIVPYLARYNFTMESTLAHDPGVVITNMFQIVSSFFIVGWFAGLIARLLRRHEADLVKERNKQSAILSHLADGLVYVGSDGLVEFMNPQAEKLLGVPALAVLGKNLRDMKTGPAKAMVDLYASDEPNRSLLFGHLDIAVKVTTLNINNNEGKLAGTAKIIYDVTREKLVDEMKSQFIMLAGHQLRTPLSAIKFALSLLLEKDFGELNDEQKEVLDKCYNYNERLIELVNDLLDVYSAEEGRFYYQYAQVDLKSMIGEVVDRLKLNVDYKGKQVTLEIAANLPFISADPQKVKLVLSSILDNAMSYTVPDGHILIRAEQANDKVMIEVADDGIGIAPEDRDKIFAKFFRTATALNLKPEGNGLDLYVVKNIVENHGGKISFRSNEGKGTVFTILLPIYAKSRTNK